MLAEILSGFVLFGQTLIYLFMLNPFDIWFFFFLKPFDLHSTPEKNCSKKTLHALVDAFLAQWRPIKLSQDKKEKIAAIDCVIFEMKNWSFYVQQEQLKFHLDGKLVWKIWKHSFF